MRVFLEDFSNRALSMMRLQMCHKIYNFMDFQRQEIIYRNKSGSFEGVDNNAASNIGIESGR